MQTNNFSCSACHSACESHKTKKNIVYNRQNGFLFLNYAMATFHAVWAKEAFKMQRKTFFLNLKFETFLRQGCREIGL